MAFTVSCGSPSSVCHERVSHSDEGAAASVPSGPASGCAAVTLKITLAAKISARAGFGLVQTGGHSAIGQQFAQ